MGTKGFKELLFHFYISNFLIVRMKLFALVGLAAANDMQWMMDTWWNEAKSVFNFASSDFDQFKTAVNSVGDDKFQPFWDFCNADGDAEVTSEELVGCGKKAAAFAQMPEEYQNYIYDFAAKYFNNVDIDGNGSLNFVELKYTLAGFAATDAGVVMKGFDADEKGMLAQYEWDMSQYHDKFVDAWEDAQVNGDNKSASRIEVAHFILNSWNIFLE